MVVATLYLVIGFILLLFSSDRLIRNASLTAQYYNLPPLLIGLTLVALGTSLPEIIVGINAALANKPAIALGNAIGSNLANTGLVLGMTALIFQLTISSTLIQRELPFLCVVSCLFYIFCQDGVITQLDGVLLITLLVSYLYWLFRSAGENPKDSLLLECEESVELNIATFNKTKVTLWIIFSLIVLPFSAELTLDGAILLAREMGISELVIGLTIIAIGTSLPELVASIISAYRNEPDICLGNVIGSNLFNLLAVVGVPALIHPITLPTEFMSRDYATMLLMTLLLFIMLNKHKKPGKIPRHLGIILLIGYLLYLLLLLMHR